MNNNTLTTVTRFSKCAKCGELIDRHLQGSTSMDGENWFHLQCAPLNADRDEELSDWIHNVQSFAGDFLKTVGDVAKRADWENYAILRPALLQLKDKYSEYDVPFTGQRPGTI